MFGDVGVTAAALVSQRYCDCLQQAAEPMPDFNTAVNQQTQRYASTIHTSQQLGQPSWQQANWQPTQVAPDMPINPHMSNQQHFGDLNPLYNGYNQQQ